jgi:hypothetical protein
MLCLYETLETLLKKMLNCLVIVDGLRYGDAIREYEVGKSGFFFGGVFWSRVVIGSLRGCPACVNGPDSPLVSIIPCMLCYLNKAERGFVCAVSINLLSLLMVVLVVSW